jgi:hypothetical protein
MDLRLLLFPRPASAKMALFRISRRPRFIPTPNPGASRQIPLCNLLSMQPVPIELGSFRKTGHQPPHLVPPPPKWLRFAFPRRPRLIPIATPRQSPGPLCNSLPMQPVPFELSSFSHTDHSHPTPSRFCQNGFVSHSRYPRHSSLSRPRANRPARPATHCQHNQFPSNWVRSAKPTTSAPPRPASAKMASFRIPRYTPRFHPHPDTAPNAPCALQPIATARTSPRIGFVPQKSPARRAAPPPGPWPPNPGPQDAPNPQAATYTNGSPMIPLLKPVSP